MKWLKRLRGKEELELPATVAFSELDAWLDQVSKSLFRDLSSNAEHSYTDIETVRERLKDKIARLQSAESTEQVPDHIAKIGLLYRDKIAKHLAAVAEKLVIPGQTDYQTVRSFHRETTVNLEFPFGKSSRNVYCVRSLYPVEIKELIAELNQLQNRLNQLIAPLKGKEQLITDLELVPAMIRAIEELQAERAKEKRGARAAEETVAALSRQIEENGNRLRMLEAGEEWKRYKALEADLTAVETELAEFATNVQNLFMPLTKPLTLLQKQDETGRHTLSPETRRAVAALLSPSLDLVNEDLPAYLRAIQQTIEGDPAVIKDRKREQALNWLEQLLRVDLSSLKETHQRLQTRRAAVTAKLAAATILAEKEEIVRAREADQAQLRQLEEEIARSLNRSETLEAELTTKEQQLLAALERITGKQIEVNFEVE